MDPTKKLQIFEFLNSSPMAVIATNGHGTPFPESALIAFDQYDNFEIVFETFEIARKYDHLMHNNHISLVVGWGTKNHITFQYEGIANPVLPEDKESIIKHFLQKDTPCSEKFLRDSRVRFFKIQPFWLRYSDYTKDNPDIFEHSFNT